MSSAVGIDPAASASNPGSGNGHDREIREIGERLARIETRMGFMATHEDIQKVKVWFLIGIVSASGVAIPAAVGVAFAAVELLVP